MTSPEPPQQSGTMSRRADIAVAMAISAFGAFIVVAVQGLRPGSIPDPLGAGGLPVSMGIFMIVAGLALAGRRVPGLSDPARRQVPAEGKVDEVPELPASGVRPLAIFAIILAATAAMQFIGYQLATVFAIFGTLWLMRVRSRLMLIAIPIGFAVASTIIFDTLLGVRLPATPWLSSLF